MDDEQNSEVINAKVTAMIVLFSISTVCGLVPFKLARRYSWGQKDVSPYASKVVNLLLAFGGGVLLSTTFCHLLPDIQVSIDVLQKAGSLPNLSFPLTYTLFCAGFFMIFFIEETVHWYLHHREKIVELDAVCDEKQVPESVKHCHIPPQESSDDSITAAMRGLMIVLALSIHELFEGLAVGLEPTAVAVWYMLGAVSAHKYVIAFCIGVELVVKKTRTWLGVVYILIYSVVSAVGIGLGTLLVNVVQGDSFETLAAILQGLSAGTLLYVVFFEIICKEPRGFSKFCAVLIGFLFIFGVGVLAG